MSSPPSPDQVRRLYDRIHHYTDIFLWVKSTIENDHVNQARWDSTLDDLTDAGYLLVITASLRMDLSAFDFIRHALAGRWFPDGYQEVKRKYERLEALTDEMVIMLNECCGIRID